MTQRARPNELRQAFLACRSHFLFAALFSMGINLLYLTYPLYMLQVYDRVLASRSGTTLLMLTLVAAVGLLTLAALDLVRARLLARAALRLDERLAARTLQALAERIVQGGTALRAQGLRDFDTVRQFVSSQGAQALFDTPWVPIYLLVLTGLHPWFGLFGLAAVLILLLAMLATEWAASRPLKEANESAAVNYAFAEASLNNTDAIRAMGMLPGLLAHWQRGRDLAMARQTQASDRAASMAGVVRFLRMGAQVGILGFGAWLVLEEQATAGGMFAASIILGRALAPVEQLVGAVRQVNGARESLGRLNALLTLIPPVRPGTQLPRPRGALQVEQLVYALPRTQRVLIKGVSFALGAGEALALVGPSGAGKTTLARLILGSLRPDRGSVRLDGAEVATWEAAQLGPFVGYLPQDVELFAGTVRDNIARFGTAADADVIAAARQAGAHDVILHLPQGYDTLLLPGGRELSAGQRQRIGLARALFGQPSLVVLDEPTAHLDAVGEQALTEALEALKAQGTTTIVIAHRPAILRQVDQVLVLKEGAVERLGPRDEVFGQVLAPAPGPAPGAARGLVIAR